MKYTTIAISTNEMTESRNAPYRIGVPFNENSSALKLGLPIIAAISGVMMLVTNEVTIAVNALYHFVLPNHFQTPNEMRLDASISHVFEDRGSVPYQRNPQGWMRNRTESEG